MKTAHIFSLLSLFFILDTVTSQGNTLCQIPDMLGVTEKRDFPDIEKLGIESYQMTVEFTLPGAKQTDYYVEYYDSVMLMGRVDSHQAGELLQYMYRAETWEAWNIRGTKCQLNNVTDIPEFFRDYQSNWQYDPEGKPNRRTIGPSAMFKMARDVWVKENPKSGSQISKLVTMGYLGELQHSHVRGEIAIGWRWCQNSNTSVDFFFAADEDENSYNVKNTPLRVAFRGEWIGDDKSLTEQYYDIINFQPFISVGLAPFEIPKGMGCGRAKDLQDKDEKPKMPNFENNMLFYSEVIYKKVNIKTEDDFSSYYSNFMFALDRPLGMLAYSSSSWNTTKQENKEDKKESFIDAPEYIVYDLYNKYFYKVDYESAKCEIGRSASFTPSYKLPENGGYLDLNSPYILFPNDEFSYLTQSNDRGLKIDVYEAVVENYLMNNETLVKNAIVTHSFLKGEEKTDNVVSVTHTPLQIEITLLRDEDVKEILTFNMFGFTTKLVNERSLFDVRHCFKNDDDYSWVTIGFESAEGSVSAISGIDAVDFEYELSMWFDIELDIKPIRVPTILVDISDALYATLLILQKPPLQLDFTNSVEGKKVDGVEGKGLMSFDSCANECLEFDDVSGKCWGFSLCGGICYMGSLSNQKVVEDKDCTLYTRFSNNSYMKTKEMLIQTITRQIEDDEAAKTISVAVKDKMVNLKPVSIQVTNVAENDFTFDKIGNKYSDRMRVFKVGKKLTNAKILGKFQFEECQRLCLDYRDCESLSYCMTDSQCVISLKYGEDIKNNEMKTDHMCQILTRKYADNFEVNPGFFLKVDAIKTVMVKDAEICAKTCFKESGFQCLSFDLCGDSGGLSCQLHNEHYLNQNTRKESVTAKASCRHYTRKYSVEFKKQVESQVKAEKLIAITNVNVEECAKTCVEYGEGSCYAFDFCQGKALSGSSCFIINTDPSRLETVYSPVCTHYTREEKEYSPRPYNNSYAGGIGFICLLVGCIIGAVVVFGIAYIRINRQ